MEPSNVTAIQVENQSLRSAKIGLEKELEIMRTKFGNYAERAEEDIQFFKDQATTFHGKLLSALQHAEDERQQLQRLRKDYEECKDRLFSLQPPSPMSDAQMAEQYDHLCEDTGDWVETELGEVQNLWKLVQDISRSSPARANYLNTFFDHSLQWIIKNYPQASVRAIACFIQRHLTRQIFEQYFVGLQPSRAKLLSDIEHHMRGNGHGKDNETAGTWRSNTLLALSSDLGVQAKCGLEARKFCGGLWSVMKFMVRTGATYQSAMGDFYSTIAWPAVQLAQNLRISPATYQFFPNTNEDIEESLPRLLTQKDLADFTMISVLSDRVIKPSTKLYFRNDGSFGKRLSVLHPALVRCSDDKRTVIRKAVLLVKLFTANSVSATNTNEGGVIMSAIKKATSFVSSAH